MQPLLHLQAPTASPLPRPLAGLWAWAFLALACCYRAVLPCLSLQLVVPGEVSDPSVFWLGKWAALCLHLPLVFLLGFTASLEGVDILPPSSAPTCNCWVFGCSRGCRGLGRPAAQREPYQSSCSGNPGSVTGPHDISFPQIRC